MLEAVQVIHNEKIVHTDLKPANFLLVEGSLKLIDFGIANAIANDTTNIHREGHQGTANYMAPEAIGTNPGASGSRKLGRASDVWSLGCILYQMVYGKTPFSDIINIFTKMSAITNPDHRIAFPETTLSPLQPKQQQQQQQAPPTTLTGDMGDARALGNPAMSNGVTSLLSIPAGGASEAGGAGTTMTKSNSNPNNGTSSSSSSSITVVIRKTAVVDPHLIRIMKGCLACDSKDRMIIPELLKDRFLHPG
ncbi:kinase-like domain-containing protein, partial [Dissophora ornata]